MSADLRIALIPGKGRGVVACRAFAPGEVVERCEVIAIPRGEIACVCDGMLASYVWRWEARGEHPLALALGFGSLYNHDGDPNASSRREGAHLVIYAVDPIRAGDEITVNYMYDPLTKPVLVPSEL